MSPCDQQTRRHSELAKQQKAKRNEAIVEAFLRCGTIHETRKAFDFTYSRDVVRSAISIAGVYDKCKRDQLLIAKYKASPKKSTWEDRCYSKLHASELEMQTQALQMLKDACIKYPQYVTREVQVPGCQMRADLVGYNWAIETKKECSSQALMIAMAQCLTYRRHLEKNHVCILIPDDLEPAQFYVSECMSYGIPIIKMNELIWWVRTVEDNAQPN